MLSNLLVMKLHFSIVTLKTDNYINILGKKVVIYQIYPKILFSFVE